MGKRVKVALLGATVVRASSRIGGSVHGKQGGRAKVVSSFANADILFDENRGPLAIRDNVVGGNVQAFQNRGGIEISVTESTGISSARRTLPGRLAAGTSCRATRKTSAGAYSRLLLDDQGRRSPQGRPPFAGRRDDSCRARSWSPRVSDLLSSVQSSSHPLLGG